MLGNAARFSGRKDSNRQKIWPITTNGRQGKWPVKGVRPGPEEEETARSMGKRLYLETGRTGCTVGTG